MRRLIASFALAGIIIPASSALAAGSGGIGVRLVGVPAALRADPRAQSYIIERPAPGTTIRRRVEISNSTHSTVEVAVYPAAASLRRGGFGFASGRTQNELSSWTTVSRDRLRLPAGTKAFETVTIDVPKHASIGQRYAVVWAEVSEQAPAAGGVTLVNRVGVRIYLSIGTGGAPRANFEIGSLLAKRSASGTPLVVAKLTNTGGAILDIGGYLTLSQGPGGLRAGPFPAKVATGLAPGYSETVTLALDKQLPAGPWQADLRLRSGFLERTARATITFPRQAGVAVKPKQAPPVNSLILGFVVLLALLAVAAVAFVLVRSRTISS